MREKIEDFLVGGIGGNGERRAQKGDAGGNR
jgi:hypothetical protein